MRVYLSNNRGCGIWVIFFLVAFFMLTGMFFKFLFTTPLGLIVLGFGIVTYLVQRQRIQKQMSDYESNWYQGTDENIKQSNESQNYYQEPEINRDAEDVVFYEADDQNPN